jgi:DNA-binding NarL/FixJ family response regulator
VGNKRERRRILLVEDDEILGRALTNVVGREADTTRTTTIAAAKRILKQRRGWDAMILDIGLPDGDGLDFLAWAREAGLDLPTLVITGLYEPAHANRADLLKAQFAFKPEILPNVKAFIRQVSATATEADATERAVVVAERLARKAGMTESEVELLRLVAGGVARSDLAERLGLSENTVKTRVRNLLDKIRMPNLDAFTRAVLAEVAREATLESRAAATASARRS